MIGFEEMSEYEQHIALIDMAIKDAQTNLDFLITQGARGLLMHLDELDMLIEKAGNLAELGIQAVGIKMEEGE